MPARPYVKSVNRCKVGCFPLHSRVLTALGPNFDPQSSEV